jgi:endonuclease-3 related protein
LGKLDVKAKASLLDIHKTLQAHFGALKWWPARHPFEVVVGAILTQNTAWKNVELAIENLRQANSLDPQTLANILTEDLEQIIRPAGYFRQKAERLKLLAQSLVTAYQGCVETLCSGSLEEARSRLLQFKGIGPETADSILLYAAKRPSFVIDAYTRRIFERLGMISGSETYTELRTYFMRELPHQEKLFNAYHAELVQLAKLYCLKRQPNCIRCPLVDMCDYGQTLTCG